MLQKILVVHVPMIDPHLGFTKCRSIYLVAQLCWKVKEAKSARYHVELNARTVERDEIGRQVSTTRCMFWTVGTVSAPVVAEINTSYGLASTPAKTIFGLPLYQTRVPRFTPCI